MSQAITVLARISLADGKNESDLLAASEKFQTDFVKHQDGVLYRELVKGEDGEYIDIIRFKSKKDFEQVMALEQASAACADFFAVMNMSEETEDSVKLYKSLAVYKQ